MANKSPKHDFAPSWLKIPEEGHGKMIDGPPRPRRDDYYGGYGRYGPQDSYYGHIPRQRSFDSYYDDRRYNGPPKMRHHSIEDDYYHGPYMHGPPFPPNYYPNYGGGYEPPYHGRGQPMFRDGKYMHPNSRFSPNMNGNYNHYDPYYDNYHDGYYHPPGRPGPGPGRGRGGLHDNRSNKENRNRPMNDHSRDEEFPSLNGDTNSADSKSSKKSQPAGAWEHPPNKSQGNNSPNNTPKKSAADSNGMNGSTGRIYKAVVPSKVLTRKLSKEAMRENFKENQPKTVNNNKQTSQKMNGVNGTTENGEEAQVRASESKKAESSQPQLINGMSQLRVSADHSILSSSLEAEQRLLREMGWNETDDEDYEITEEEMREFENLKQIRGKQNGTSKCNGSHNSIGLSNGSAVAPKTKMTLKTEREQDMPKCTDLNDSLTSNDST